MKNRTGMIVLIVLCVLLGITLIWSQRAAMQQKSADAERIGTYSNQLADASSHLSQQLEVNKSLESDLKNERDAFTDLTNAYTTVSSNLDRSETSLKMAQDELTRRNARIADLESQNQVLDQRALDLGTAITNLNSQIDDTRKKLAASEGDKAFLEKELEHMMAEKAELERQFNDIAVLRAQVAKLKKEMSISRRLEWMRQGVYASRDKRGGEKLTQKTTGTAVAQSKQPGYDLNVEVSADGTVRVVPPSTNSAALTAPSQP